MPDLKIKIARQEKGLTQIQLAEIVGTKKQSVNNWEHGRGIPGYDKLKELSKALGLPMEELFEPAQPV